MDYGYIPYELSVYLVTIAACLFIYSIYSKRKNLPPGPQGLPVIGNIIWFWRLKSSRKRLATALFEESKKYGDIVFLRLGFRKLVVLHGYDTIQDVFVKQADVFSNRPHWLPRLKEPIREGKGLIWQSGEEWKILRKFTLQSLREFGVGKTTLEDKIVDEIDAATNWLNNIDSSLADIKPLLSKMITNIIYGIVFGKRYDYDDVDFHTLIHRLGIMFKGGGALDPNSALPEVLLKLLNGKKLIQIEYRNETVKWIKEHIYNEIETHRTTFDYEHNTTRDFIDLYIQAEKASNCMQHVFTEGNIFRIIMDLFLAGSETTSTSISWCVLFMMEYPDVQKRCQDEIQEKYGERPITWSDRGTMPFVEATLLEIQRMANVAQTSLPHTTEVDTTIHGYFIPRRTLILANLYSSSMDTRYWEQPEVFRPERFLEHGQVKKNPAMIPFSIGPRVCVGESLAKMEMFLIFTNFLQRFSFHREHADTKHSFECEFDQITCVPVPFKTKVVKRR